MQDAKYPHTSWFTVSDQPNCKREYCYNLIADRYVTWSTKETKKSAKLDRAITKEINNLIYIKQAFGNAISIAEKVSVLMNKNFKNK